MLLELADFIRPALTLVDAVVAMEGDGPGSGDPIDIGVLLAGSDPLAVDAVAIDLVGMKTSAVWTQHLALQQARPQARLTDIELISPPLATLRPRSFTPSKVTDVSFGLPERLRRPLNNALTARPVPDSKRCRLCGICVESCPPQAMAVAENELRIDYARCIRCFCCQELCPHAALETRQGLLLRLARFLRVNK
jgi:ferredoxin